MTLNPNPENTQEGSQPEEEGLPLEDVPWLCILPRCLLKGGQVGGDSFLLVKTVGD